MKAKESLFLLLSGITAFTVLMTGCVKQPDYSGPDDNGQGGGNGFDYATVADVKINVDYSMKGNKALFEVFAENPVTEKDGLPVRNEGVKSLLKAYTDKDSKYAGVVNLPTATDKVWLYSESYGLPTCVETQVTASGVSFNLDSFLENLASQQKNRTAAAQAFHDARRIDPGQCIQHPDAAGRLRYRRQTGLPRKNRGHGSRRVDEPRAERIDAGH